MFRLSAHFTAIAIFLTLSAPTSASLIGSHTWNLGIGGRHLLEDGIVHISIKMCETSNTSDCWYQLGIPIFSTSSAEDNTAPFIISNSNTTNFGDIDSVLTNGIVDVITLAGGDANREWWWSTDLESYAFFGNPPATGTTDFVGYDLSYLEIFVDDLGIESPDYDPNGDGIWTTYRGRVRMDVYGEQAHSAIPEPSSLALMSLSILGLCFSRQRRLVVTSTPSR